MPKAERLILSALAQYPNGRMKVQVELAEKQQAEAAKDAKLLGMAPAPTGNVTEPKREKGVGISRIIRSSAAARGDFHRASIHAEKVFGDAEIAKALCAAFE